MSQKSIYIDFIKLYLYWTIVYSKKCIVNLFSKLLNLVKKFFVLVKFKFQDIYISISYK